MSGPKIEQNGKVSLKKADITMNSLYTRMMNHEDKKMELPDKL
jgi:hypothetical protein